MATVSDLAQRLGVSPSTIRAWTGEFSEYLTPEATPSKHEIRIFSKQDEAALRLVAEMREEGQPYEAIHAALAAGERATLDTEQSTTEEGTGTGLTVAQLTALVGEQRGEIGALRVERDRLISERDQAQAAHLEAAQRAAAAEREAEILRNLRPSQEVKQEQEQEARRPWWKIW